MSGDGGAGDDGDGEPDPIQNFRDFLNQVQEHHETVEEQLALGQEIGNLRLRRFVEDLSPEQVTELHWIIGLMAGAPPEFAVRTACELRGLLTGELWRRRPLGDLTGLTEP